MQEGSNSLPQYNKKPDIKLNYHFMVDDKFIDRFIHDAEAVAAGTNTYIFLFSNPGKYVKSSMGIYAPYGSGRLKEITGGIREIDRVFVHWFNDALMPYLNELPAQTKLYLLFWGGDFLEQSDQSLNFNLEKRTRRVYDHINRYAMFHLTANPGTLLKQLKMFITVDRRWREWRKNAVSVRSAFMKRLDFFCHWNELDYDAVKKEYGGNATFKNFFYDPRFDQFPDEIVNRRAEEVTIWLGNSATFPNNHFDLFEAVKQFRRENLKLIAPLSYGNKKYGSMVEKEGMQIFGDKFRVVKDFLPADQYFKTLRDVDVVVMYHNRTQAAGNILAFLRMGKKVFLKRESSIFPLLENLGVKVFDANKINEMPWAAFVSPLNADEQQRNRAAVNKAFSAQVRDANLRALLLN